MSPSCGAESSQDCPCSIASDARAHPETARLHFTSNELQNPSIEFPPRMLKPPDTISIEFVRGMLSGVGYPEHPPLDWLEEAGIPPDLLNQSAARVTADQYVALFQLVMDKRDDEFLGFLSRQMRRGTFALLVRCTLGATTLEQALRRLRSTFSLLQDDIELTHVREADLFGLRLGFRSADAARNTFLHELVLRVFWRLIAWLHGGRLKASGFDLAFPAPAHVAEYAKVFPGSVRFDQTHTTMWFDAASLDAPMLRDERAAAKFLAQAPGIVIIPQRSEHAASARVRAHLQTSRPTWPDLATTADALHLSTSTLQRHLAAEGLNFQAVKDQLRLDVAIVRLNTSAIPLTTLALELGFADSPAFQRAFKNWTGSAPGTYRRSRGEVR
jgi:AraC-like DNA-binding protein